MSVFEEVPFWVPFTPFKPEGGSSAAQLPTIGSLIEPRDAALRAALFLQLQFVTCIAGPQKEVEARLHPRRGRRLSFLLPTLSLLALS